MIRLAMESPVPILPSLALHCLTISGGGLFFCALGNIIHLALIAVDYPGHRSPGHRSLRHVAPQRRVIDRSTVTVRFAPPIAGA
jgi:hypothetical protein